MRGNPIQRSVYMSQRYDNIFVVLYRLVNQTFKLSPFLFLKLSPLYGRFAKFVKFTFFDGKTPIRDF
jgi:hypothetical protein